MHVVVRTDLDYLHGDEACWSRMLASNKFGHPGYGEVNVIGSGNRASIKMSSLTGSRPRMVVAAHQHCVCMVVDVSGFLQSLLGEHTTQL